MNTKQEDGPFAIDGDAAIASHETELTEQKDRYIQLAADFDNFRKRTARESNQRAAAQKERFIHELLPIVDNLERALAAGPDSSFSQIIEGVGMTLLQLRKLLSENEIISEESVGKAFDPRHHEAIGTRNDPSQPDHTVLETTQRGYSRGKEMFRPARVIVNDHSQ